MFSLFVLFVDLLPCVICGLLFIVLLSGVLGCGVSLWSTLNAFVHALGQFAFLFVCCCLVLCEYCISMCLCIFWCWYRCICVSSVCVVLQRIDSCHRVMFLLHEGHMYFVCYPGLLSMFQSVLEGPMGPPNLPTTLLKRKGRLAEKTTWVKLPSP